MKHSRSTRRSSRIAALQCLYGLYHTGYDCEEVLGPHWGLYEAPAGGLDEEEAAWVMDPPGDEAMAYATRLVRGVCAHEAELDDHIHGALENWSPDRVGPIERCVLRIAVYEMLYVRDVPGGVAINEAIEVVKTFGAEEAARFINGVLDRLRRAFEGEDA